MTGLPPEANAATAAQAAATCDLDDLPPKPPPSLRALALTLCAGRPRALQTALWTMSTHCVPEIIETEERPSSGMATAAWVSM